MAEMHGRLPDGTWVRGVETFRRIYTALGLGPVVWLTRLPGVSHALDWGYRTFARNRVRLVGRCDADSCGYPPPKSERMGTVADSMAEVYES